LQQTEPVSGCVRTVLPNPPLLSTQYRDIHHIVRISKECRPFKSRLESRDRHLCKYWDWYCATEWQDANFLESVYVPRHWLFM